MSVFKKVLAAHAQAVSLTEHKAAAAELARSEAEAMFAKEFAARVEEIAKPIFEKFAADARDHGFPAITEHQRDGDANPMYGVRLNPEVGAQLGPNASDEIAYVLKGVVSEQRVEHGVYFDQRPGRKGTNKSEFGIGSIKEAELERRLGEFLSSALKARAV